jgi:hypothetical protein
LKSELIVMLTHHDQTVQNASEVFDGSKDLPVNFWGFKDIGLPRDKMAQLVGEIKAAGKTAFLEVVSYTEESCLAGAQLAVECGFDCLMGTLFYESVWKYLSNQLIRYYPFVGKVYGSPSVLEGTAEGMLEEIRHFAALGIHGVDLLGYRYTGDPEALAAQICRETPIPICLAGSIDSVARLKKVNEIQPETFTMGSALFDGKFIKDGSYRDNLIEVIVSMKNIGSDGE